MSPVAHQRQLSHAQQVVVVVVGGLDSAKSFWATQLLIASGTLDYTLSTKTHLLQQDPAWCTIDGPHATISRSQE